MCVDAWKYCVENADSGTFVLSVMRRGAAKCPRKGGRMEGTRKRGRERLERPHTMAISLHPSAFLF